MKKILVIAAILVASSLKMMAGITVGVTFTTKAHWNGSECANVDKGLCVRLTVGTAIQTSESFTGSMTYDKAQGLILTFNKVKELDRSILNSYFGQGAFHVDADSPISNEVLQKIGFPNASKGFTILKSNYKYIQNGDNLTVVIPVI